LGAGAPQDSVCNQFPLSVMFAILFKRPVRRRSENKVHGFLR
jgi:hypothetical protein